MQLNPGENSLMTYFASEPEALAAMQLLQANGFHDVQVSFISEFPRSQIQGASLNISSKVLGRGLFDQSHGPLLAADPSVSGISSHDSVINSAYLLTVVTDDAKLKTAQNILGNHGGVYSPGQ